MNVTKCLAGILNFNKPTQFATDIVTIFYYVFRERLHHPLTSIDIPYVLNLFSVNQSIQKETNRHHTCISHSNIVTSKISEKNNELLYK